MKLKDYIQGKRRGKDANHLEREAMNDPFLQDALDGFDSVEGNHIDIIHTLEKRVTQKTKKKNFSWYVVSIAASIAILIGVGIFFLLRQPEGNPPVLAMDSSISKENLEDVKDTDRISEQQLKEQKHENRNDSPPPPVPIIQEEMFMVEDIAEMEAVYESEADIAYTPLELEEADYEDIMHLNEASPVAMDSSLAYQALPRSEQPANAAKKSLEHSISSIEKIADNKVQFGKEEFEVYFKEKYTKNICKTDKIEIQAEFYINESGEPKDIQVMKSTCEEITKEFTQLLEKGPKWTTISQKVKLKIRIK